MNQVKKSSFCEVSIVFPCLNEEKTIGKCIQSAKNKCDSLGIHYEIIVADNGSTDLSLEIAKSMGVKVERVPIRGYGAAIMAGVAAAQGRYIIQLDSDNTYRLDELERFLDELRDGASLVMGNRFAVGGIKKGAMPWLHRFVGNPVLSWLGRILFKSQIRDFHCGLRGYNRDAFLNLGVFHNGMEFASEVILKFTLTGGDIRQFPTSLYPDERAGGTHLNTFRDGWRHLRYLLLYSPRSYLFVPSLFFISVGWIFQLMFVIFGDFGFSQVIFSSQTLVAMGFSSIFGLQLLLMDRHRMFSMRRIFESDLQLDKSEYKHEKIVLISIGIGLIGILGLFMSLNSWKDAGFGDLDTFRGLVLLVPSICFIMSAVQISSYSILEFTSKNVLNTVLMRKISSRSSH